MSLQPPDPQDIVIIGVSGDLARRKLLPALYNLAGAGLLPEGAEIIGFARSDLSTEGFRQVAREAVKQFSRTGFDEKLWARLAPRISFVRLEEGYTRLKECTPGRERLVYLAVPPSAVPGAVRGLRDAGLVAGTRLVVEKPFGRDLASARELHSILHESFDESQIFRIDHYLGKETVQNILVFRFGNSMFERVWHRDAIEHVQITVAESIGVEGRRGASYEEAGALRDIVENHVLQVLAVLTMEPPANLAPEAIRDEKAKVLRAMRPLDPTRTVRGQYARGTVDGSAVPGYGEEKGVAPDSTTETFFAAQLEIDTWRWAGVPFFLRTGKRLPRRATEVVTVFRQPPLHFFEGTGIELLRPDHLVLRIQPDEGISLTFLAKQPGPEVSVQPVSMDFSYSESFMTQPTEAYERLLHEAMDGDHTLFAREDAVERAWVVIQPALEHPSPLCTYPAGTWGPQEADQLIAPHTWHLR